jgi:hypothetical protein
MHTRGRSAYSVHIHVQLLECCFQVNFRDGQLLGFRESKMSKQDRRGESESIHIFRSSGVYLTISCRLLWKRIMKLPFRHEQVQHIVLLLPLEPVYQLAPENQAGKLTVTTGIPINANNLLHSSLCSFVTLTCLLASLSISSTVPTCQLLSHSRVQPAHQFL